MKRYYLKDILGMKSYMLVNKFIVQTLGTNEAIMLSEIQRLEDYFDDTEKVRGHFWSTYDKFVASTGLAKHAVSRAIATLEKEHIIDSFSSSKYVAEVGHVCKVKYYMVNTEVLEKFMKKKTGFVVDTTMRADSTIVYNRVLAQKLTPIVTVLLEDLYTAHDFAVANDLTFEDEYFKYITVQRAKLLGVSKKTMVQTYLPQLKDKGIIETIQLGFPKTTYIKINEEPIMTLLGVTPLEVLSFREKQAQRRFDNKTNDDEIKVAKDLCNLAQSLLKANYSDLISAWEYNENILSYIKGRLENNTPDTLERVMKYKFNTWDKPGKNYMEKYFNVSGLYTASALKQHLIEIGREDNEKELEVKAYDILEKVMSTVKELDVKNLVKDMFYTMKSYKVDYIRYCLKDGCSEEDIIAHAVNRYNYYIDNYSEKDITAMYTFNSLYDVNGRKKIKEWTNNSKKKSYKTNNSKTKDNVTSKSYTQDEIAEIKRKAQTGEEEVY